MNPFTIFITKYSWFGFIRLFFYPLTTLIATPVQLVRSLWNCRILIKKNLSDYNHFIPFNGLDTLFYWTSELNISRFGTKGVCPYIGLGNYPLSKWFHYSTSLSLYRKSSNITLLVGMFGWLISHFVWLGVVDVRWILTIMFLAIISTTFYANTFALQNYNVLGWIFFPLGLYGLFTENWIVAGLSWLFASFGSFTIVFLASVISIVWAIANTALPAALALIPSWIKLLMHFYPLFTNKSLKTTALNTMKGIGMYRCNVKYKMQFTQKDFLTLIYILILYGQFIFFSYLITGEISAVLLTGVAIFVANSTFMRFADVQDMHMLMFSLATVHVLLIQDWRMLLSYWLLISPLPAMLPFPFMQKVLDIVPVVVPFFIKGLIKDMESFFEPVKTGERVLLIFADPKYSHSNIFEGYRALLQLAFYVASKKEIHLMPDWWAVNDVNYEGAPDFWGRDIPQVLKNIEKWKPDFVIIYQEAGSKLDVKWEKSGFRIFNKFSWADHSDDLRGIKPYIYETPDWWLLEIPKNSAQLNRDTSRREAKL